ncbi:MAG TPA: ribose-phosphate pyrophosphokinase [Niabella sp.]|nr:ribose-phosphate pyrophosphokinase [Niabella sp.]HQW14681.1 ribose-phosphate pyrophosphokinase [Niabella sp.]HQX19820.1 ribose-phosphate pyrophosphokinase [Niabella sp.]HQX42285.1 ribose-phosphate pyrophosphokinase [Niabella sp.]HRB08338.1 ribose-phosphate pyrophosphokinase [Niabella sp.]
MQVAQSIPHAAKIFSGTASEALASEICSHFGCDSGKLNIQRFADGEISPNFLESVRGDYIFLVQSTYSPADNIMELLLMIDAAKRASAYKVIAVLPYYGYARQDRKDRPRVAIGSKLIANMLTAAGADRIITMDLHAPQIQGYFDIPVDHLDSHAVFIPYIEKLQLKNLTFAAPDVGATNRIREIASYFNADMVICDKHRKRANEIASMRLIGDVEGRDLVIIDDICDTGGTLAKCAALIKERGANSVRAMITHPLLSGKAYETIEASVLEELVVCNTIPMIRASEKIKVISVAELFSVAIKHAFENKSITSLFVHSNLRTTT